MSQHPNVLFVFGDQWRASATGYEGNPDVRTPHLDAFAGQALDFRTAVAQCPVCSPWRASLMTGQFPLTHGVFVNDVPIASDARFLAECYAEAGYDTAYVGKWHIDGHGRESYIPPERRQGFQYWKVLECTHQYNRSQYYAGDDPTPRTWEGYDAIAQTEDLIGWLHGRAAERAKQPFLAMLSWGPPHNPFETAPERFRALYDPARISLPPNVPEAEAERARVDLAGYYAHCSALDECFGRLRDTLARLGLEDDTLIVFTSDHGDMIGSQGQHRKQRPWDESLRVPLLVRWPNGLGPAGRIVRQPIAGTDLMPTLLDLCGLPIPETVEGDNYGPFIRGESPAPRDAVLCGLYACFHEFTYHRGGRDWRALRSERYTYVQDHDGPWLLFDHDRDPHQLTNLVGRPEVAEVQQRMQRELAARMAELGDTFPRGQQLIADAGIPTNDLGDPTIRA